MTHPTQQAVLLEHRILLLENNAAIRHMTTVILRRHFKVRAVDSEGSQEAILDLIREVQPRVVLIGLPLGSKAVFMTISRIKSTLPDLMLVGLTSLQGEAYRRAALAAGLIEVIAKSQLASELNPILKRLIVADLRR